MNAENVFVDCYGWLKEIEAHPNEQVPMCGVFRHVEALSRVYNPVFILRDFPADERIHFETVKRLENYLGHSVTCFSVRERSDFEINRFIYDRGCKVWISPAPECVAPTINFEAAKFKRLTIVHDASAFVESGEQRNLALIGAQCNDLFAYVSAYAWESFRDSLFRSRPDITLSPFKDRGIAYGCFHNFKTLPPEANDRFFALSVANLYQHKRIIPTAAAARSLGFKHLHAGDFSRLSEVQRLEASLEGAHFVGPVSDKLLRNLYSSAECFLCLSSSEGYSMTPLEAAISGVPKIMLSDIPIHRELYGSLPNVVFEDDTISDVRSLTREERQSLFEKTSFEVVSQNLRNKIEEICS